MTEEESKPDARDILIELLYSAVHDMIPHYTQLYSAHAPDNRLHLYDELKAKACAALDAKAEFYRKQAKASAAAKYHLSDQCDRSIPLRCAASKSLGTNPGSR